MSAARSQCQVFLGQPLFLFPRVPAEGLPCDVTCRGEVWELISEFEFSFLCLRLYWFKNNQLIKFFIPIEISLLLYLD